MPRFKFKALDQMGKKVDGKMDSLTEETLIEDLKKKGLYIFSIKEEKESILKKEIELGRVKQGELAIFTRQLATLIKAGVTITDSIRILREQTENRKFKKILLEVELDIKAGKSFSNALSNHPKIFPILLTNMVKAGEISGRLENSLLEAATYLERESDTLKKVKTALTYPIFVIIFTIFTTIFILLKVVPQFVKIYEDLHAELPLATRFVIGVSNFIKNEWYIIVGFLLLIIISIIFIKRTEQGRYYLDYVKLKIPVYGKLIQKSSMLKFSSTLSSLLSSSIPILQGLQMVSQVVDNEAIGRPIRESIASLRQGNSIHVPLKNYWVFPPLLVHMIAIGEETGKLDELLSKVAGFYQTELEATTDQLKSLIEPFMIIFLTVVVGTIVLAVLAPMFGIYDIVG